VSWLCHARNPKKQPENDRFKPKINELPPEKPENSGQKIKVHAYSIPSESLTASPSQKQSP
jgi:hypothetical protein